jgi:hypothetical protein
VRLPISDGKLPVRELEWILNLVIAVRLLIPDGIDPVRDLEERRLELRSISLTCLHVYSTDMYIYICAHIVATMKVFKCGKVFYCQVVQQPISRAPYSITGKYLTCEIVDV